MSAQQSLPPLVSVAYGGVHQAYQIALAAQESGRLRRFYCSLYSDGNTWGGWIRKVTGSELQSRRLKGLDLAKIRENPWPLARKAVTARLRPSTADAWLATNEAFDRWSAAQLRKDPVQVVVGTETCDLFTLRTARELGTTTVHDCPQIHPEALRRLMQEASEKTGQSWQPPADEGAMEHRKLEEYALADHLLVYSDFHRRTFEDQGFKKERIFQCPLWVDAVFWQPAPSLRSNRKGPLRVLFVGSLTLRKGLPFLLRAMELCRGAATLTVVGPSTPETASLLQKLPAGVAVAGPMSKTQLRDQYLSHDAMVLPSVADSFGFVALEAMSCGLPVLISENCGAPVPPEWRTPAMDHEALAGRLLELADGTQDWEALREQAITFSRQFTPQRYRAGISGLLEGLIHSPS